MQLLDILRYFYTCAEYQNFSRAAKILGITQPTLSTQIKNLENQVGTSLFLRNGKSISLTSKGKELFETSKQYYQLQKDVQRCLEIKRPPLKPFRILVTEQIERPFVAELVAKLAKKEKVKMAIYSSTTEEALNKTQNDETDILLSHEKVGTKWNFIKIEFPVFLVTSSSLPKSPTFDDLRNVRKVLEYFGEDLIVPAKTLKLGKEYAIFKAKHKIDKEVLLESNIVSCLVRFCASGTGCSFLPLPYIKSSFYEEKLHLIGPREGYWKHAIYIYGNLPAEELEAHPLVKGLREFGSLRSK